MDHVELLKRKRGNKATGSKDLLNRVTGRFYTHDLIAGHLVDAVVKVWHPSNETVRIIEPFCGDGRLISLLLKRSTHAQRRRMWEITIWDCDDEALKSAKERIISAAKEHGILARVSAAICDSFSQVQLRSFGQFDVCVTNPPWELT